jgi:hypothetical protein
MAPAKVPADPRLTGPVPVVVPVIKVHTLFAAKALPERSLAPVVTVAVNVALAVRLALGVNVAIVHPELQVTVPVTLVVPGPASVKVNVLIVAGSIPVLKVALTAWLMFTPVAALSGAVEVTVGAVAFEVVPVVNVQAKVLASALPARSLAPVVIVAV